MVHFKLEAWSAMASGLGSEEDWSAWFSAPSIPDEPIGKEALKQIPAMLRRRFKQSGKCALGAALPILKEGEMIPSIFSSRHGDIEQTLALLEGIGRDEPMSPTGFSLAVHNAISGLFSIVRKDMSEVTTIAASKGLIFQSLFEAIGQLQVSKRVLCVIYDIPLPQPYSISTESDPFPFALAMILNGAAGDPYNLQPCEQSLTDQTSLTGDLNTEALRFIELLTGKTSSMTSSLSGGNWRLVQG